jgi:hypothetical protein
MMGQKLDYAVIKEFLESQFRKNNIDARTFAILYNIADIEEREQ